MVMVCTQPPRGLVVAVGGWELMRVVVFASAETYGICRKFN